MSVFSFLKNDIPVEGATVTYLTKRKRGQSLHLMVTAYNGQALDIGESSVCLGTLCIFHIMANLQRIIYRRLLEQARKAMFSVLRKIKVKKELPLETMNTQNHENRRLGSIKSLHMQHCSLRGCIRPLAPA